MKKLCDITQGVRKLATYLAISCSVIATQHALADDNPLDSCQSLLATGNPEYAPFLWQSADKVHLSGAVSFLLHKLGDKIDIPIKIIYVGPWSRAQQEVRSGRVDLMAGAFYTSERADYMEYFSPAMMFTKSVVWQSSNAPFEYHNWNDLRGRWGVTVINNSFGQSFDDYAKRYLNLLTVASLGQAFSMLKAGRADYVLYERSPGLAYAEYIGMKEEVIPIQPTISSEGLYLTISKQSPCNTPDLKQRMGQALRELVDEGVPKDALVQGLAGWADFAKGG